MSEKRIVKRMATCNSCKHFKEARRGNWVDYTPICIRCPTQIGINEYKEGSEKTVTWLFNCTEALFCPNYEKANDDYVSRVRKGMKLCHPDSADKPYNQIYKDKQFYKTEHGKEVLVNLGVKRKSIREQKLTNEERIKRLQKENAELKVRVEKQNADILSLKGLSERQRLQIDILEGQMPWEDIKDKSKVIEKLTKAKEIIKNLHEVVRILNDTNVQLTDASYTLAEAEQFLNGVHNGK